MVMCKVVTWSNGHVVKGSHLKVVVALIKSEMQCLQHYSARVMSVYVHVYMSIYMYTMSLYIYKDMYIYIYIDMYYSARVMSAYVHVYMSICM